METVGKAKINRTSSAALGGVLGCKLLATHLSGDPMRGAFAPLKLPNT